MNELPFKTLDDLAAEVVALDALNKAAYERYMKARAELVARLKDTGVMFR